MSEKPFEFTAANGVRWQLQVCSLLQCVQATEADLARALPVEVVRRLAEHHRCLPPTGKSLLDRYDALVGEAHACAERESNVAKNTELLIALDGLEVALQLKQDEIDGLHEELRKTEASRRQLADAALIALASAVCTPAKGYADVPGGASWLSRDIGELRIQRDVAAAKAQSLRGQVVALHAELQRSTLTWNEQCEELRHERDAAVEAQKRAEIALAEINEIRNSIIGTQTVNWSAHVYPLVEVLNGYGLTGETYDVARAKAITLLERAEESDALRAENAHLQDGLSRTQKHLDDFMGHTARAQIENMQLRAKLGRAEHVVRRARDYHKHLLSWPSVVAALDAYDAAEPSKDSGRGLSGTSNNPPVREPAAAQRAGTFSEARKDSPGDSQAHETTSAQACPAGAPAGREATIGHDGPAGAICISEQVQPRGISVEFVGALRQAGAREELIEASRAIKPIRPPPLWDCKDSKGGDRSASRPDKVADSRRAGTLVPKDSKEVMQPGESNERDSGDVSAPVAQASSDCTSELAGAIVGK